MLVTKRTVSDRSGTCGEGITVSLEEVGVFEQRLQGSEGISQEATRETNVLEMGCQRPKFGKMPSDFLDQLKLKWLAKSKL